MLPMTYADPSPSRTRYRFERIWLKPWVRRMVLVWFPAVILSATIWVVSGDPALRENLQNSWVEFRTDVAARPELQVTDVAFPSATDSLQQQILTVTGLTLPISVLDLDVGKVKAAIESLDAVKSVEVQVVGDGILEIRTVERAPELVWRDGDVLRLIDAEGRKVAIVARRSARGDLPLIAGESAVLAIEEAILILEAAEPISDRLRGLVRVGERRWDVVLDRGQTIMLPEFAPVTALQQVLKLHQTSDLLNRDVALIDMRDPSRPVLRLTDTAIAELRRLRTLVRGEDA